MDIRKMCVRVCVFVCVLVSLLKKIKITLTTGKTRFNKESNKLTKSLEELGEQKKK